MTEAGNLTPEEYKAIADEQYAHWYTSKQSFYITYENAMNIPGLNTAALLLHQSTEHCFACLLLVITNYKPYAHNLNLLNSLAILQNERIAEVFPQDSKIHRRRFQL